MSSSRQALRCTALHGWHRSHGASMAEFSGYEMPLWYPAGARREHLAVLTAAGAFDTSHMAEVLVRGPGAFDLLQRCFSRDLGACWGRGREPLSPGRCVYGVFLDDDGGVIDDAVVYAAAPDRYLVVVNAGMGDRIAAHLRERRQGEAAEVVDLDGEIGKIDVQGRAAARALWPLLERPEAVLRGMAYFTFRGWPEAGSGLGASVRLSEGTRALVSRTGYTGEFGFELLVPAARVARVWELLLEAGGPAGLEPCGLAARDSLRAGAVLPLSHQDIGPWPFLNNPWVYALPWRPNRRGFTKDFVGRRALETARDPGYTYPFVGYDLRKVAAHGDGAAVLGPGGDRIGKVLTCVSEMGIGRHGGRVYSIASPGRPAGFEPRGLSCGFIRVDRELSPGQVVRLADARREIRAEVVRDIRPDRTARVPIEAMIRGLEPGARRPPAG